MPSKIQPNKKHASKRSKKTEDAVALFRREVEEQERLVDALRSHQQDRTDRIERIKSLLASGSELASAVGVWESPANNKEVVSTALTPGAAVAVSREGDTPPVSHSDPNAALSHNDDNHVRDVANECGDITTAARVSEIKDLAAGMMQAVMEEFGGYMAGMEQHRAVLEGLKGTAPSSTTQAAEASIKATGDVDAEEEAALQELVEFRQRIRDKKKNRRHNKKNRGIKAVEEGTGSKDTDADTITIPTDDHPSGARLKSSSPSPDAEMYLSLLDKLTSNGEALALEEGCSSDVPFVAASSANSNNASPEWFLEGFEPAGSMPPAATHMVSIATPQDERVNVVVSATIPPPPQDIPTDVDVPDDLDGTYSDDFEADE